MHHTEFGTEGVSSLFRQDAFQIPSEFVFSLEFWYLGMERLYNVY